MIVVVCTAVMLNASIKQSIALHKRVLYVSVLKFYLCLELPSVT